MLLKFDNNGLAIEAGNIHCFYYDPFTFEYTGWSDEYIYAGVSMPGNSTSIDPGEKIEGKIAIFNGREWVQQEDHRGETVYSINDGNAATIDYIGQIKDGFTTTPPKTLYDTWNGQRWITDTAAQHAADVAAAEFQKQRYIDDAMQSISVLQLKLQAGRLLSSPEKEKLNAVLDYIDAVTATNTITAPDVSWPVAPAG